MVAVFNKELLSWYLITLKLKEAVDAGLQNPTRSPEAAESSQQQQQAQAQAQVQVQVQAQRQQSSKSQQVEEVIKEGEKAQVIQLQPNIPLESEWVISIREKLEEARQDDVSSTWAKLSIYRVPLSLRDPADDKAYIPQVVSLGPYHHGERRLQEMDRHKWRALHHTLKRSDQDIKIYLDSVKELEEKARACYELPISLSTDQFVEMMVLDGCFILELFRGVVGGFKALGYSPNDPIFSMRGTIHSIQRDMIMLENQIPLFILDRLFGLQLGKPQQKGLVAQLALRFFDPLMPTEPLTVYDRTKLESSIGHLTTAFDPLSDHAGLHCLDVFRRSLLYKGSQLAPRPWFRRWSHANPVVDKRRQQLIHCATDLKNAGVKFRKRKTDRFWDIKFENGVLKIPQLLIHDGTKSLFFNLIAFEQCHLDCTNEITSYVIFMDNLVNSAEDVAYLHHCGIIEHWLGSDTEVADLIHRLCQEVVFDLDGSSLSQLSGQVNTYYNHRWNAWKATLRLKYFNNPWAIISFIAAVFLLLLTFTQTFFAVYSYYRPSS
ncbi:hypothetical protein Ancab_025963 [Ancistrocladus abbreviatus]